MPRYSVSIQVPRFIDSAFIAPVLFLRWVWYGYSFRRVKLIGGKYALVSIEDFHELSQYTWLAKKTPRSYTAVRFEAKGRVLVPVHMHRQVMVNKLRPDSGELPDKMFVDHKNRNSIDNRRPNLRLATESQNCMNRCGQRGTSSRYKGVTWNRRNSRWYAAIQVDKRNLHLGCFESEQEAARAYDAAARKYQGEFAYQNFPTEQKQRGLRGVLRSAFCVLRGVRR